MNVEISPLSGSKFTALNYFAICILGKSFIIKLFFSSLSQDCKNSFSDDMPFCSVYGICCLQFIQALHDLMKLRFLTFALPQINVRTLLPIDSICHN